MSSESPCPDVYLLHQFTACELSEEESESVREHLTDCKRCTILVETAKAEDTQLDSDQQPAEVKESDQGAATDILDASQEVVAADPDYAPTSISNEEAEDPDFAPTVDSEVDSVDPEFAPTVDSEVDSVDSDFAPTINPDVDSVDPDFAQTMAPDMKSPSTQPPKSLDPTTEVTGVDSLVIPGTPKETSSAYLSSESTLKGKKRYLLKKEFARGGLGCVWLGYDQHIARDVAIKELLPKALKSPTMLERFYVEAQVTGQLEHPSIVPIYELGIKPDGSPFYTMKLLKGRTYADAIKEYHSCDANDPDRAMKLNELLGVFVDVCNAMAFAHEKGVLHRDLKPLNIMLGDFGEAIVVDWGLAKVIGAQVVDWGLAKVIGAQEDFQPPASSLAGEDAEGGKTVLETSSLSGVVRTTMGTDASQTMVGAIMGTPMFMSPEQAGGKIDEMDARSDIYTLGSILYDVLVGRPPYRGKNPIEIIAKVTRGDFQPPRAVRKEIPAPLEAICLKAMAHEIAERYSSAKELGEEISRWQAGEPVSVFPEPLWRRGLRWAKRHRTLVTTSSALIVTLLILMILSQVKHAREIAALKMGVRAKLDEGRTALEQGNFGKAQELVTLAEAYASSEKEELSDLISRSTDLKRQVRRARLESVRSSTLLELSQGREALSEKNLQEARDHFIAARTNLRLELSLVGDPSLVKIENETKNLLEETEKRLDAQASRLAAGKKIEKFHQLLDDALFLGTAFTGLDEEKSLEQAQVKASEALELFSVELEADTPPSIDERYYTPKERSQIVDGCYELLFVLAESVAQPKRGQTEEQKRDQARRAVGILDRARAIGPTTHVYHLRRGKYFEWIGDGLAVLEEKKKAKALGPATSLDYFLVGDEYYTNGDYELALKTFGQALRLDPAHFWAQFFVAGCHIKLENWSEATASLTACLNRRPDFVWIYILRGWAYGNLGEYATAYADFEEALGRDPNEQAEYGIHLNRGALRIREGRFDEAAADLQEAIDMHPDWPNAYLNLADLHRRGQNFTEALKVLDKAIVADRNLAQAYRTRAGIYREQGESDAAFHELVQAIKLEKPGSAVLADDFLEIGRYLRNIKRYPEALANFDAALNIQPDHLQVIWLRSLTLIEIGKNEAIKLKELGKRDESIAAMIKKRDESLAAMDRYIELSKKNEIDSNQSDVGPPGQLAEDPARTLAYVYTRRGLLKSQLGKDAEAMQDYTRAKELVPDADFPVENDRMLFTRMLTRRAWAYLLKANELALLDFEEAIKLDPENGELYNGRGYAFVQLGKYREAVKDAEGAVRRGPTEPYILANAAHIYGQAVGKVLADAAAQDREELVKRYHDRALELLERALPELPPQHVQPVLVDPALDPIRQSPKFQELVDRYTKPDSR